MEKQWKPVPDIECLKYHGTPEKPDIKIFVSHRIDLDSETIDNPIYIPVRCGAVFDEREGITMLGDDTGDNISEKRAHFSELTVQYWAWKNIEADYYGLCHYRRFLDFSGKRYPADPQNIVNEQYLEPGTIAKHRLDDQSYMRSTITAYDAVIADNFDVRALSNLDKPHNNVWEYWLASDFYVHKNDLELLFDVLVKKFPDYEEIAKKYLRGHHFIGYNCFVLRKDLFADLCEFEFQILFAVDKQINYEKYSESQRRTPAFFGEILYSIWLEKNVIGNCSYCRRQLLKFENQEAAHMIGPAFKTKGIPIVMISSDYYTPYTAVCLKSILYHSTKQYNYDFIILTNSMDRKNKEILCEMCHTYTNVAIRFYNPEPMLFRYKQKLSIDPRIDLLSFYRIAMPYFMVDYKKIICIDCDLVFEADIANLYEMPLDGCYLAAVKDLWVQGWLQENNPSFNVEYCKKIGLKNPDNYVNTGVAIYNLSELFRQYSFENVVELSIRQKYFVQEQDVINLLVDNHVKVIDGKWNVLTLSIPFFEKTYQYVPYQDQKKYLEARKNPFVIHWAGYCKPWMNPDVDLANRFWFYARMSPLYEVILHRLMLDAHTYTPTTLYYSKARRLADRILPKGSRRRSVAKKVLPKGSKRWNVLKKCYYRIFKR